MTWDLHSRSQQAGAVILMVVPVRAGSVAQSSDSCQVSSLMMEERE